MKKLLLFSFLLAIQYSHAQEAENIIVITTDGFRWQDLFKGMDSAIANNKNFHEGDSLEIYKKYWAGTEAERRKRLLPFFWNTISEKGQIYGNRDLGNKVDNANRYWFSYPGYNEILTGYPDTLVNSNDYQANPHQTVLEFLNKQAPYKGKVAAFGAWEAFNRIINEKRSGIPVVAAYDNCGGANPNANEKLINAMLQSTYRPWGEDECFDVFTHFEAMETLKNRKPKVLYIAYGETDEWAHAGRYRSYLDAAHQVDAWISEIWNFVQSDPQYRNKTAIFITTDHGRGDKTKKEWTSHGQSIEDAHEIWFAAMGPSVKAKGEMKESGQFYQQQFAQTIANLLGLKYVADHPIAEPVKTISQ